MPTGRCNAGAMVAPCDADVGMLLYPDSQCKPIPVLTTVPSGACAGVQRVTCRTSFSPPHIPDSTPKDHATVCQQASTEPSDRIAKVCAEINACVNSAYGHSFMPLACSASGHVWVREFLMAPDCIGPIPSGTCDAMKNGTCMEGSQAYRPPPPDESGGGGVSMRGLIAGLVVGGVVVAGVVLVAAISRPPSRLPPPGGRYGG